MSLLAKLTLSNASPREKLSPVARKRMKLLEQLDIQITAAQCELDGSDYLHSVRKWVRVEGSTEKQLITKPVHVKRWWWTNEQGQLMVSLRQGNRVMEVAPDKVSIEVGDITALPEVLKTLREAIVAGELDEQLKVSPFVRPIPKAKGTKAYALDAPRLSLVANLMSSSRPRRLCVPSPRPSRPRPDFGRARTSPNTGHQP